MSRRRSKMSSNVEDDPPPDLRCVDDPPPDLRCVDDAPPDLGCVDDPPPDLRCVDDAPPDLGCVDDPPPDLRCVDDPPPDMGCVDDALADLQELDFDFVTTADQDNIWCEQCRLLKQELEKLRQEHALNYNTLKKKIISTDLLIKKYKAKCEDHDAQTKAIETMSKKLEQVQRESETLRAQLGSTLQQIEPVKKAKQALEADNRMKLTEIESLQDKLTAAMTVKKQYENLAKSTSDYKDLYEEEKKSHTKKVKELESSFHKQETQLNKYKDECKSLKLDQVSATKKQRKLEDKLKKTVERLDKYWCILKDNGLLPKGEKKLRTDAYLEFSDAHDLNCSQDENPLEDCIEPVNCGSLVEEKFGCHSDNDDDDMSWTFSPMVHILSPLPPSPMPFRQNDNQEKMDADDSCNHGNSHGDDDADDDEFANKLEAELSMSSNKISQKLICEEISNPSVNNRNGRQLIRQSATVEGRYKNSVTLADTRDQNSSKGFSLSESLDHRNDMVDDFVTKSPLREETKAVLDIKSPIMDDFKENMNCGSRRDQDSTCHLEDVDHRARDFVSDKNHKIVVSCQSKLCSQGNQICDNKVSENEAYSLSHEKNNEKVFDSAQYDVNKFTEIRIGDKTTSQSVASFSSTINTDNKSPASWNSQSTVNSLQPFGEHVDKSVAPVVKKVSEEKVTKQEISPNRRLTRSSSMPLRTSPRGNNQFKIKSRRGSERLSKSTDTVTVLEEVDESKREPSTSLENICKRREVKELGEESKMTESVSERSTGKGGMLSLNKIEGSSSDNLFMRSNTKTKLPTSGLRNKSLKKLVKSESSSNYVRDNVGSGCSSKNEVDDVLVESDESGTNSSDAVWSPRRLTRAMSRQVSTGFALQASAGKMSQPVNLTLQRSQTNDSEKSVIDKKSCSELVDKVRANHDQSKQDTQLSKDTSGKCDQNVVNSKHIHLKLKEESVALNVVVRKNIVKKYSTAKKTETIPEVQKMGSEKGQHNLLHSAEKMDRNSQIKYLPDGNQSDRRPSLPLYIPFQSSLQNSQQNIASSTVVSPEIAQLTEGGATLNSPSTPSVRSTNSSVMAASSPVSPLPPSPFDFFIPMAISPLPPSPVKKESSLSPPLGSPEKDEDDDFYNDDESTPRARFTGNLLNSPVSDDSGDSTPIDSTVPSFVTPLTSTPGSLGVASPITPLESPQDNRNPCSFHAEVPLGVIHVKPKSSSSHHSLEKYFVRETTQNLQQSPEKSSQAADARSTIVKRKSSDNIEDQEPKDKKVCLVTGDTETKVSIKSEGLPLWKVIDTDMKAYIDMPQEAYLKETVSKEMVQRLHGRDTGNHRGCVVPVVIQWIVQRLRCNQVESLTLLQPCWEEGGKMDRSADPWTPLLTQDEARLLTLTSALLSQSHWDCLQQRLLESLWNAVFLSDIIPTTGVTALCRLITAICRLKGDVEQVHVLYYNILLRSNLPCSILAAAIAGVWPQALYKPTTDEHPVITIIENIVTRQLLPGKQVHDKLLVSLTGLCHWSRINLESKTLVKQYLKLLDDESRQESPRKLLMFETEKALELLLHVEPLDFFKTIFIQCGLNQASQRFCGENWLRKDKKEKINPEYVKAIVRLTGFTVLRKNDITTKYVNTQIKKHLQKLLNTRHSPLDLQICIIEVLLELSFLTPGNILHIIKGWCNSHQSQIPLQLRQRLCWTRNKLVTKYPGLHCPDFS